MFPERIIYKVMEIEFEQNSWAEYSNLNENGLIGQ